MKKTLVPIAAFLLVAAPLFSQSEKGVNPVKTPPSGGGGTTRAVVIGISDYQDVQIPDLRFAARDAEAFAGWLQSPAGGALTDKQLTVLTNKNATTGKIIAALDGLISASKPGDAAVIYFSGHGDVERVTKFQRGYWLTYDSPPAVYAAGAFSLVYLQDIITTLSEAGVQVVVVSDACRAGKLAGNAVGGSQATAAALAQQFANEIKVLSCQPNEFSLEGEQWGGGRGAFSFHLVDALYGLADANADGMVSLMEVGRYLEDHVPAETAPHPQLPFTVGNRSAALATVRPEQLVFWKKQKEGKPLNFNKIEGKGLETMALEKADSSIRELYEAFTMALERGELMEAAHPARKSANELYEILKNEPSLADLHGLMTRNFAAALIDEGQQVTNKMLKTDPNVVSDAFTRPFVFDHIPLLLARAAEILGEEHFFYKNLKSRQLYFEGKTCLPDKYPELSPDSVAMLAAQKYEEALRYDANTPYVHVELAFLWFYVFTNSDLAWHHAKKALELSPSWVYANYAAANSLRMSNPKEGKEYAIKAIAIDSTFLLPYQELALNYYSQGEQDTGMSYSNIFIQKIESLRARHPESVPVYYRVLLGAELWRTGRLAEAEAILEEAAVLTKRQSLAVYQYLGLVYLSLHRYEEAILAAERQLELAPYNPEGYFNITSAYKMAKQPQNAVKHLQKALVLFTNNPSHPRSTTGALHILLAEIYRQMGQMELAKYQYARLLELLPDFSNPVEMNYVGRAHLEFGDIGAIQRTIDEGLKKFPDDPAVYYQASCLYSLAKQETKSLEWLEQALKKGFKGYYLLSNDEDLSNIRLSPTFGTLMKKHFPDKVKD